MNIYIYIYCKRTGGGFFSRAASSRDRILIVTRQNQFRDDTHTHASSRVSACVSHKGSLRPYNIKPFATTLLLQRARRTHPRANADFNTISRTREFRRGFQFVLSPAPSRNMYAFCRRTRWYRSSDRLLHISRSLHRQHNTYSAFYRASVLQRTDVSLCFALKGWLLPLTIPGLCLY